MYKGYVVDKQLIGKDPHFKMGCAVCHRGNAAVMKKDDAHQGLVKKPSDNLNICGMCHKDIAEKYKKSLHYTTIGQRNGVMGRFSKAELKDFDEKVFEKSCRSCHASCGDCHVKAPPVGNISLGLIDGHKFVKKNEAKTCAFCHGGRVYPEYTGEYGGTTDVHYQKGMMCMDCHKKTEFHGDGAAYASKQDVKDRPRCTSCHRNLGKESKLYTRIAHNRHKDKVSCYGCHSAGEYRNCYSCHLGTGSQAKPGFILGLNPRDLKTVTTLRLIPTVRDTFAKAGIKMENYDALPNYWDSPVHNIRKRTDRTRSCDACHVEKKGFLTREKLIENGSQANRKLLYQPKPIPVGR
jgi:thiosulfate/3-mercaptopyruvate sulfurtransferase